MKRDITQRLKDEHQLILKMLALLEKNAGLTEQGSFRDYQFYLDGVDFIRNVPTASITRRRRTSSSRS